MYIETEGNDVVVHAKGMELLRVKATLSARLGSKVRNTPAGVRFPLREFPAVADLLPQAVLSPKSEVVGDKYQRHSVALEEMHRRLAEGDISKVPSRWLERLDPAQSVAAAAMTVPGLLGFCLFDEQGTGKTVMALAAFDILREAGEIDAMIVSCPKSMIGEWPKAVTKFIGSEAHVVIAEGNRARRFQTALGDFDVLVTTYEGIASLLIALASRATGRRLLLAADESFLIKNADAKRTELAHELRSLCAKCFVLCGTPAPNSPYDLVSQFDLADQGFTFAGFAKSQDEERDSARIADLVDTRGAYARRLKTEVLANVPEKDFQIIRVRLSGRQEILYNEARESLALSLRSMDNVTFRKSLASYFQRRSVLLQICSVPSSIDPGYLEMPAKYGPLDSLINNILGQNGKVILWSSYRRSIDELCNRYAAFSPLRIDGAASRATRAEAVDLFQDRDSGRNLFIGNPAAAGAGLTLHASHDAIYVSYSNQAAHYIQSLDRIHRRGQEAPIVRFHLLVCENTIEETEICRLRHKELQQHRLLGDHVPWPSSLDEALAELGQNS